VTAFRVVLDDVHAPGRGVVEVDGVELQDWVSELRVRVTPGAVTRLDLSLMAAQGLELRGDGRVELAEVVLPDSVALPALARAPWGRLARAFSAYALGNREWVRAHGCADLESVPPATRVALLVAFAEWLGEQSGEESPTTANKGTP